MMKKWMIGAAMVMMLVPAAARAHKGHAHTVMGTVTARHDNHVELKTPDGKTVTVTLDEKTTFARGARKVDDKALQVGERVVVDVGDGKSMIAKSVKVGPAAAAAKN